ncbi:MAG: hypothetical protein ICV68_01520 [Pyrinomonadaceae bacterium]|nr:hypothetical protein [Pyrinomonadaceae bacterium]
MAEPPYSVEEFWDIVSALAADVQQCAAAHEAAVKNEEDEKQGEWLWFWRRMCAHTVFSLIEGATYHLMYIAYVARNSREVVFSLDELEILEKAYDFDDEREVEPGLTQEQMLERIKFAFNAFARVHYSDYILPTHEEDWLKVKETFRIKAAISSPQLVRELEVMDDDVTVLLQATAWFVQRLVALVESCRDCAGARVASWEAEKDEPIM